MPPRTRTDSPRMPARMPSSLPAPCASRPSPYPTPRVRAREGPRWGLGRRLPAPLREYFRGFIIFTRREPDSQLKNILVESG